LHRLVRYSRAGRPLHRRAFENQISEQHRGTDASPSLQRICPANFVYEAHFGLNAWLTIAWIFSFTDFRTHLDGRKLAAADRFAVLIQSGTDSIFTRKFDIPKNVRFP
jgi:hypothetical protein